jgi:hypothetical protein
MIRSKSLEWCYNLGATATTFSLMTAIDCADTTASGSFATLPMVMACACFGNFLYTAMRLDANTSPFAKTQPGTRPPNPKR